MATDLPLDHVAGVLRRLTSGVDPGGLLQETVVAAARATGATRAVIVGRVEDRSCALAQVGATPAMMFEVAERVMTRQRSARKTSGSPALHASAEPLRIGSRVVGALVVAGPSTVDAEMLPVFAAAAALVLTRCPTSSAIGSAPEILAAAARIADGGDEATVLERTFLAAEQLFDAAAGFCVVTDRDAMRVAHLRCIDRSRMRATSRRADFRAFVTSPGMRIDGASHPVVAGLTDGVPTTAGLPLVAGEHRIGQLVLFLARPPSDAMRALMETFASHVALSLQAAEAHRELSEKEEQLASIVHAIGNPVLVADHQGRLELVNAAGAELFHLALAFEAGQPVRGRLGHELVEQLLTGEAEGPTEVVLGDGEPRVYRATVSNVRVGSRNTSGRVLVLDDVTRRAEADQLKSDFVAVIGHELRTPLTVMKGYVSLLQRGIDLSPEARAGAITALSTSTHRLARLVEDLLFAASLESTRPPLELGVTDVRVVLGEHVADRVCVSSPAFPVSAAIDEAKLNQVVAHLVDNALKCSTDQVTVELIDRGDEIEVGVIDEGEGIFSGDIATLFERFHQLDASSTRSHGGTGMGLYLCRRLVELQGGRIWCESRLGVGSRFAFRLPKGTTTVATATLSVPA